MVPTADRQDMEMVVVHGRPTSEEVAALVVSLGVLVRRARSARRSGNSPAWLLRPASSGRWALSGRVTDPFCYTTFAWGA